VPQSAVRWLQRCPACRAWLRGRALETNGPHPSFEIDVVGRPDTRTRVDLPWDEGARRRLETWLVVASVATLLLVALLFVLARAL
jgi:hypothetical protein